MLQQSPRNIGVLAFKAACVKNHGDSGGGGGGEASGTHLPRQWLRDGRQKLFDLWCMQEQE